MEIKALVIRYSDSPYSDVLSVGRTVKRMSTRYGHSEFLARFSGIEPNEPLHWLA